MPLFSKKHQFTKAISILFIGLIAIFSIQAQQTQQGFITSYNGDLWKFDVSTNTSIQLTTSGYNHEPILSPDGLTIAYTSVAPEAIERMKQGEFSSYDAMNIYLMDVNTEEITLIAGQVEGSPEGYMRATLEWSPDSSKLMWTQLEFTANTSTASWQIYDLNTSTTSTFLQDAHNVVGDAGMVGFDDIQWTVGGIATMGWTFGGTKAAIVGDYSFGFELDSEQVKKLEVYDRDTGGVTTYSFVWDTQGAPSNLISFIWVTYQGRSLIALESESRWELLDPMDGSRRPLDFPPHLRNIANPNRLELFYTHPIDNPYEREWQVSDGQSAYSTGYTGWYSPTISPDGTMLVWHDDDGVSTWQVGIGETVLLADNTMYSNENYLKPYGASSVAWGASEWFINEIVSADCPNSPPTRFTPEMTINDDVYAIVLPGDPNNIRSNVGEEVIGKIPAGSWMYITGSSKCDENGIRYYPIQFNDNGNIIDGWTAEGQGSDYWIKPFIPG